MLRIAIVAGAALALSACAATKPMQQAALEASLAERDAMLQARIQQQARAQEALASMARSCQTDLCRYLVAKEGGAAIGAVEVPEIRIPTPTNAWDAVSNVANATAGVARAALPFALGAYGLRQQTELVQSAHDVARDVSASMAGMDRADYSTTIHGDSIGGDRVEVGGNLGDTDNSTTTVTETTTTTTTEYGEGAVHGDGNTVGDNNGDGDRISDNSGRIDSDGNNVGGDDNSDNSGRIDSPSDDSDNSDNSDNSTQPTEPTDP